MTLDQAREYAAGVKIRKAQYECQCDRCKQAAEDDQLQAVQNILANWPPKKIRRVK